MPEAAAQHPEAHPDRPGTRRRVIGWIVLVIAILGIAMVIVNAVVDEPLRRYLERRINAALDGYTVTVGRLDLHLLGLAVELDDVTVVQNARPRPPVIYIPRWTTSVEFRALLSLAVVADTHFDRPQIFFTQDQAVTEARDPVPVTDRGWQDAVTAVYPLKINTLRVSGGTITYHDQSEGPPIRMENVIFWATNIRNVRSIPGRNPSEIRLDSNVFGKGVLHAHGHVDFFAKPSPTMVTDFSLRDANLDPVAPAAKQFGITLTAGTLAAEGQLVEETESSRVALRSVVISMPAVEYSLSGGPQDRPDVEVAKEATRQTALQIDDFRITDGTVTLDDVGPLSPVRLEKTNLRLTSVGNVPGLPGRLPSGLELDCSLFGSGSLRLRGRGDLLAKPQPVGVVTFDLERIGLSQFGQLVSPWNLAVTGGSLSVSGEILRDVEQTKATVHQLSIAKPVVEYAQRTARDEERVEEATKKTTEAQEKPAVRVDLERANVTDGYFGLTVENKGAPYRLFLDKADITLEGFSNERSKRAGVAHARAWFMDSGPAALDATFEGGGWGRPEFELEAAIDQIQLTTLNDLLRSKGGFDVTSGLFSFYTDLKVRNGRIDGYVKPFFQNMTVYDREQDSGKPVGQQLYEALVGGAATVLENRSRDQVATRTDLSGPVENPEASTWQIAFGLIRNAFWRAILPGLERQESSKPR
jgi:Domain of Unknown Function (DUF748)